MVKGIAPNKNAILIRSDAVCKHWAEIALDEDEFGKDNIYTLEMNTFEDSLLYCPYVCVNIERNKVMPKVYRLNQRQNDISDAEANLIESRQKANAEDFTTIE